MSSVCRTYSSNLHSTSVQLVLITYAEVRIYVRSVHISFHNTYKFDESALQLVILKNIVVGQLSSMLKCKFFLARTRQRWCSSSRSSCRVLC